MVFENGAVLSPEGRVLAGMTLCTEGDRIAYLGKEPPAEKKGRIFDASGMLLLPGFVNTHSHIPMTLMRGYGEGLPLQEWLNSRIFPFEACMDEESAYAGAMLGIAEMLAGGITSFSDMYFFCGGIRKAVMETGIKANLSHSVAGQTLREAEAGLRETDALIAACQTSGFDRIKADCCLHAEYSTGEPVARAVAERLQAARKAGLDVGLQVHLSETALEHSGCKQRRGGRTPAEYLDALGLLEGRTTVAHAVASEPSDWELFARKGVTVAHCPKSNLKLGSGIAPVADMARAGVSVCVATDGAASNNALDLLDELKTCGLLLTGVNHDPALGRAQELFPRITRLGALAQGRMDTGELRAGRRADLAVMRLDGAHLAPALGYLNTQHPDGQALLANCLYAGRSADICLTMVDGEVLYENGSFYTLDIERVRAGAEHARRAVLSRM